MGNAANHRVNTGLPGLDSSIPKSVAKNAPLGLCIIFDRQKDSTRSYIVFPPHIIALNLLYSISGEIRNRHPTNNVDDTATPVPEVPPDPADGSDNGITIPIAADEVMPVPFMHDAGDSDEPHVLPRTSTDSNPIPPPEPMLPTIDQAIRPVFHGDPSDYMNTDFLKRCFTCNKEIGEMVDIYMYKDLSFCSNNCRNREMDKDYEEEMKNREKKKKNTRSRRNAPPKENEKVIFFISDA